MYGFSPLVRIPVPVRRYTTSTTIATAPPFLYGIFLGGQSVSHPPDLVANFSEFELELIVGVSRYR